MILNPGLPGFPEAIGLLYTDLSSRHGLCILCSRDIIRELDVPTFSLTCRVFAVTGEPADDQSLGKFNRRSAL